VKISPRYLLVEITTATLFTLITWKFPPTSLSTTLDLLALLYLAAVSITLALIDLDTHTLPNRIVLPSYIVGTFLMGASAFVSGELTSLTRALVGAVLMWSLYFLMAIAYNGGMGFGDVKTAGALGLFLGYLGWKVLIVGAFSAFLLGGIFALGLIVTKKAKTRTGIPFGPWMLIGAWIGIFLGGAIAQGYLNLFGLTQII
jgi:leader peptidase (prepilin peptidase)/N-methyltransferase